MTLCEDGSLASPPWEKTQTCRLPASPSSNSAIPSPGPYAGSILADLGADVIKVESPDKGDYARDWGPPFAHGTSTLFHVLNHNKRGLALDLRDRVTCERLIAFILDHADVVLQNMRPGAIDKLGLGAAALRAKKPSLIYCDLGAYGRTGPFKDRPGYDPLMQAHGGIMSITGVEGGEPVRVGCSIVDQGAGMWAAMGILAALNRRHVTGEGCHVSTSLFETAIGWMGAQIGALSVRRPDAPPDGIGRGRDRAASGLPDQRRLHHGGGGQ